VSGYVETGYVIALGSLSAYAISLVVRERAARNRLPRPAAPSRGSTGSTGSTGSRGASAGDDS